MPPFWVAPGRASWTHRWHEIPPHSKLFIDNLLDFNGDFHPGIFCMILILVPIFCLFWCELVKTRGSEAAWLTHLNKPSKSEKLERQNARVKLKQAHAVATFAQNADESMAWERHLRERRDERNREGKAKKAAARAAGLSEGEESGPESGPESAPKGSNQKGELVENSEDEVDAAVDELVEVAEDKPSRSSLPERPLGNELYRGSCAQSTRRPSRMQRARSVVTDATDHRKFMKHAKRLRKSEARLVSQLDRLTTVGKVGAITAGKGAFKGAKDETRDMFKQALRASAVREAHQLFWDVVSIEANKVDIWLENYQNADVSDKAFLLEEGEGKPEKDSEEARDLHALATMDQMETMASAPSREGYAY